MELPGGFVPTRPIAQPSEANATSDSEYCESTDS